MLTDADRQLITAAVDGELSPADTAAFRALLTRSAEASALYERLADHARRLGALPRAAAPASLAPAVLARVSEQPQAEPASPRVRFAARRVGWLPYVVAASLLLAVAAGSFWLSLRPAANQADGYAEKRLPPVETPHPSPARSAEKFVEQLPAPHAPTPPDTRLAARPAPAARVPEAAPSPRTVGGGDVVFASPDSQQRLESVQVRLPFLANVADLDRKEMQKLVREELKRDPAFRLDLFTKDVHQAATVFQAAARSAGVAVTVDKFARERTRKKLPAAWAIYTESLTADEIAQLLAKLAVRSRAGKTSAFTIGHLVPAQAAEQKDLRDLLGVEVALLKRPKPAAGPKSISDGTADQLAAALRKGGKSAILLTYLPVVGRTNPSASKEIRAFLERRGERKPAAVPLLIVIRPAL
jgi:hypothetical protein